MPEVDNQFCKRYHKALVMAIKDEVEKVKSKMASNLVKDWIKDVGGKIEDEDEFRERFQEFLEKDLAFAQSSKVDSGDGEISIEVEGCHICPGNELLRQEGEQTLCPIIPTGLFSISRVHGKRATLEGVEKSGEIGTCKIKYRVEEKTA